MHNPRRNFLKSASVTSVGFLGLSRYVGFPDLAAANLIIQRLRNIAAASQ